MADTQYALRWRGGWPALCKKWRLTARLMLEILAIIFAALWTWSLLTANPLGGFLHVFLVLAILSACHRFFRCRHSSRG